MPDFFLSDFHQMWIMSTDFYKISQIKKSNFTEICPVGAALIHADRRRDIYDEGNTDFKGLGKRA
jgi:hypothetical protein